MGAIMNFLYYVFSCLMWSKTFSGMVDCDWWGVNISYRRRHNLKMPKISDNN